MAKITPPPVSVTSILSASPRQTKTVETALCHATVQRCWRSDMPVITLLSIIWHYSVDAVGLNHTEQSRHTNGSHHHHLTLININRSPTSSETFSSTPSHVAHLLVDLCGPTELKILEHPKALLVLTTSRSCLKDDAQAADYSYRSQAALLTS